MGRVCYHNLLAMSLKTDPKKASEAMHLDLGGLSEEG